MSTEASSPSKRKPTEEPEAVVSNSDNCDDQSKSKARRVSTDASASTNEVLVIANATSEAATNVVPVIAEATSEDVSNAQQDESMLSIGTLVQDLFHFDNTKVKRALDALHRGLEGDKKKCDNIQVVGGCHALMFT
jgi:hypothetical protein